MKSLLVILIVFCSGLVNANLNVKPNAILPLENRAVLVKFLGGFTGFDADAYKLVRSSMAALLTEGTVDKFVTTQWGFEGGSEFCVELNPDPSFSVDRILNMLKAVRPGNNSIYEFNAVLDCASVTPL